MTRPKQSDPDSVPSPTLPLPAEVDAELLRGMRERFEAGEHAALLRAISHCARQSRPLPRWAADAFLDALARWWSFTAESLDDAFNVALPKGKHLAALRKRKRVGAIVYAEIERLRAQGRPVGAALFAEVGRRHALGKTLAEEVYRERKQAVAEIAQLPGGDLLLKRYMTAEAKVAIATRKIAKLSGSRSRKR